MRLRISLVYGWLDFVRRLHREINLRIFLVYGWLDCVCRFHHEIKDFFSLWLVALCVQASP